MTPCPLSRRELEVVQLAARTNREIGQALGISWRTVRNHFYIIALKLSAAAKHTIQGRTAALIHAREQNWLPLQEETDEGQD